jgi:hypothetical protein
MSRFELFNANVRTINVMFNGMEYIVGIESGRVTYTSHVDVSDEVRCSLFSYLGWR